MTDTARGLMTGGPVADGLRYTALWPLGLLMVFVPLALCVPIAEGREGAA